MSQRRRFKRKMVKDLGVETHSDIVKRKLKQKSESSRNLCADKADKG